MKFFSDTFKIPTGEFSIAVDEAGAVAATAFGSLKNLRSRLGECNLIGYNRHRALEAAKGQVLDYFAGQRREFELSLAADGTDFQHRVWTALQKIPFGETRSYGELAAILGNSKASRAVGRANATNPICLIVPCHRVIGADGSLTGFAFGENIKRWLLEHEQSVAGAARSVG